MRLYLSAYSKKHIGYTPDTLMVRNQGVEYTYDIIGTTDYDIHCLCTRTKGNLEIRNEHDEFEEMDINQIQNLMRMLRDDSSEVTISIYPVDEAAEGLDEDELVDCSGRLEIGEETADFAFHTEFYGI